jgi:flavin-dependent dehydrogenase
MCDERSQGVDVVVVGGGPAGVAAALTLHEHGLRVEVVERTHYTEVRLGETLPPTVQMSLVKAGLWEAFLAQAPRPAHGVRSHWGSAQPMDRSFLFNPYGDGWHIDRRLFDSALARVARAHGIRVTVGARAVFRRDPTGTGWLVDLVGDTRGAAKCTGAGSVSPRRARWLVLAAGRRSPAVAALGTRNLVLDRLVAVAGFLAPGPGASPGPSVEPIAVIEAVEDGWWYSAPLPDGRFIVTFFTDPDICARQRLTDPARWAARLYAAPATSRRIHGSAIESPLWPAAAGSARLAEPAGPGWVAVGDSAQSHDPLSGNGVANALDGGRRGAEALMAADVEGPDALAAYVADQSVRWAAFAHGREAYYTVESRWPRSPFWQRRHSHPSGSTATHGECSRGAITPSPDRW